MRSRDVLVLAASALAGSLATLPARAVPIIVSFSGAIGSVGADPGLLLDDLIVVGSLFSGTYTIDPDDVMVPGDCTPPLPSCSFFDGIFHDLSPAGSIAVTVQALPFSDVIEAVFVGDNASITGFPVGSDTWLTAPFASDPPDPIYLSVSFSDTTGAQIGSDAFFVNQSLAGWDSADFQIVRTSDNAVLAGGSITSLAVVPEPATAALVAAGAALLAAWRRRALPAS